MDNFDSDKSLHHAESDPITQQERAQDPEGSFLDLYRSRNLESVQIDEFLVNSFVYKGVVPATLRYEHIVKANIYRGMIKSTQGDLYYFTWNPEMDTFKSVPVELTTPNVQQFEQVNKSLPCGCNLKTEHDDEDESEKAAPRAMGGPAASAPVPEAQYVEEQQQNEVNPGAIMAQTPDDPNVGRQWHAEKALQQPTDGVASIAFQDNLWTTTDLIKAWGQTLQKTAPKVAPALNSLEAQYLSEVMGLGPDQIQKGVSLPPRHRIYFEKWKNNQLRGNINYLKNWLKNNQ